MSGCDWYLAILDWLWVIISRDCGTLFIEFALHVYSLHLLAIINSHMIRQTWQLHHNRLVIQTIQPVISQQGGGGGGTWGFPSLDGIPLRLSQNYTFNGAILSGYEINVIKNTPRIIITIYYGRGSSSSADPSPQDWPHPQDKSDWPTPNTITIEKY